MVGTRKRSLIESEHNNYCVSAKGGNTGDGGSGVAWMIEHTGACLHMRADGEIVLSCICIGDVYTCNLEIICKFMFVNAKHSPVPASRSSCVCYFFFLFRIILN